MGSLASEMAGARASCRASCAMLLCAALVVVSPFGVLAEDVVADVGEATSPPVASAACGLFKSSQTAACNEYGEESEACKLAAQLALKSGCSSAAGAVRVLRQEDALGEG